MSDTFRIFHNAYMVFFKISNTKYLQRNYSYITHSLRMVIKTCLSNIRQRLQLLLKKKKTIHELKRNDKQQKEEEEEEFINNILYNKE